MKLILAALVVAFASFVTVPSTESLRSQLDQEWDTTMAEVYSESNIIESIGIAALELGAQIDVEETDYRLCKIVDIKISFWGSEPMADVKAIGIWGHWFEL